MTLNMNGARSRCVLLGIGGLAFLAVMSCGAAVEDRAGDPRPAPIAAAVGAIVKVTWTGTQSESVPTVAFSNVRIPSWGDIELFVPLRTAGVHYGNDDTESNGRFLVADSEMVAMLSLIEGRDWRSTLDASSASVSITWGRLDTNSKLERARELLFGGEGGAEVLEALLGCLDHTDGPRRFLADMYTYLGGG